SPNWLNFFATCTNMQPTNQLSLVYLYLYLSNKKKVTLSHLPFATPQCKMKLSETPSETIQSIIAFSDIPSFIKLSQTSKKFRDICNAHWKLIYGIHFMQSPKEKKHQKVTKKDKDSNTVKKQKISN